MEKQKSTEENIGIRDRIGMAFSGANISLVIIMSTFLNFFCTDVIGMNAGVIGTIFLISRCCDGLSDLVAGRIIDKTRTKKGVCRPWIYRIIPFFGLGIVMNFTVPNVGDIGKIVYLFIVYNISTTIIYTISTLAVQSLPTFMTRDNKQQTELYAWNNVGVGIISMIISGLTMRMAIKLGGDQRAWIIIMGIYACIAMACLFVTATLCKERINPDSLVNHENKDDFKTAIKAILHNKYWFYVLGIIILVVGVFATSVQMHAYYAKRVLNDIKLSDFLNIAYGVPAFIFGFLLIPISKKISAKNIILIGAIIQLLGCIMIVLQPANIMVLLVATALKGIGNCCGTGMFLALLGATIEYGQWKTGIRNQTMIVAANGAGQKLGNGIITAFIGFIMAFVGYDGTLEVQSAAAISGISSLFLYLPLIMTILEIILTMIYDLDKHYDSILEDLKKRETIKNMEEN